MSRFSECLAFTLIEEGGLSTDPNDPGNAHGGATDFGITLLNYRAWRGQPEAPLSALEHITDADKAAFYGACYWNPVQAGQLHPGIDLMVFDEAVNSGVHRSALILQQAVGVAQDGHIGPVTIAAANAWDDTALIGALYAMQLDHYEGLALFPRYGKDWLERLSRRACAAEAA